MAKITLIGTLACVPVTLRANNHELVLHRMLLDTGSAYVALKNEDLNKIGIYPPPSAIIQEMRGIGGT